MSTDWFRSILLWIVPNVRLYPDMAEVSCGSGRSITNRIEFIHRFYQNGRDCVKSDGNSLSVSERELSI